MDKPQLPVNDVSLGGFAVAAALVAFLLFRLLKSKPTDESAKTSETSALPPLKLTPKPQRFEAKTARPLPQTLCVEGSAFVTDGDTIVIKKTQIRLFGIDAPELNHPYGQKAKWAMVKLCKGHKIRAEVSAKDAYGRTVARCFLPDGRDLSAEMVKQGLAIDWPKFSGGKYSNLETPDARKKLWLASARQKGHMHVWRRFEASQREQH